MGGLAGRALGKGGAPTAAVSESGRGAARARLTEKAAQGAEAASCLESARAFVVAASWRAPQVAHDAVPHKHRM